MSEALFEDTCQGCLPVALDPQTGQQLGEDTPIGFALMRAWGTLVLEERQAFHRVCCLNSRDEADLNLCTKLTKQVQAYLETLEKPES